MKFIFSFNCNTSYGAKEGIKFCRVTAECVSFVYVRTYVHMYVCMYVCMHSYVAAFVYLSKQRNIQTISNNYVYSLLCFYCNPYQVQLQ